MQKFKKIIFICTDNTCCSIMAEAILADIMKNLPPAEQCDSASRGLVVLFPEPLNIRAQKVLADNGLSVEKEASEALSVMDIGGDTLLLTMTQQEKRRVTEQFPKALNLYTLCEFAGQEGEVQRLYGGTEADYLALFEQMDLLVKFVVRRLRSESKQEAE